MTPLPRPCEQCEGHFFQGNWVHDFYCPRTVVLWKAEGHTAESWADICDCPVQELTSVYTHAWDCPFWATTIETPIDHFQPVHTEGGSYHQT